MLRNVEQELFITKKDVSFFFIIIIRSKLIQFFSELDQIYLIQSNQTKSNQIKSNLKSV